MSITGERSPTSRSYPHDEPSHRGAMVAITAGILFVLVGALGFIPGATKHIAFKAGERFSGTGSHAMLFGIFQTSVLANLIFLAVGLIAAVSSFFVLTTRLFFFVGAVFFAFLAIYGFSIDLSSSANFLPMNTAASFLHAGIAVVLLITGLAVSVAPRR